MIRGKVTGRIWSSRHIDKMPNGGALLEIKVGTTKIIAFDPLGCAKNEEVLITQGSVAAGYFTEDRVPIDALIIGSIDEN